MKNLISLILIVLSIALGIFVVKPAYDNIQNLRAEKTSYDDALQSATRLTAMRDSLVASYNGISDTDKAKLALILPQTFDPVKLASDMAAIAAADNVIINHVSTIDSSNSASRADVIAAPTSYRTSSVNLTMSGTFQNFLKFLKEAESDAELLDLRHITIAPANQGSGLTFDVSFDTYTLASSTTQ